MERILLRLLSFLVLGSFAVRTAAQNEVDALRFSTVTPGGTARSIGLANAFGALGADAVSVAINPAGLGLYRNTELSFTPALEVNTVNSAYGGITSSDVKSRFHFSNVALILNSPAERAGSDWRSSTFGVVFDRQATHHWGRQAVGRNVQTSILDDFAWQAEGTNFEDIYDVFGFSSALAWQTYGLDLYVTPSGDTIFNSYDPAIGYIADRNVRLDQTITTDSRGSTNNTAFFYSGNYMDKLYIGMSVGIVGYRYKHKRLHSETVLDENVDLKDLTYREDLAITGNGVDVKAGVIYRFHDRFRAGIAVHSPMWLTMNDAYNTSMNTTFRTPSQIDGRSSYSAASPDGIFSYKLNSPLRAVLSAAYIAGEHGLVSVDYEYADYTGMRFRPSTRLVDSYTFTAENEVISAVFRPVHSVRAGTEWRSGGWCFRMGWGFVPDAYRTTDFMHAQATRTYAGGVGYRTANLSVDLGANYIQRNANYYPYDPAFANVIREERNTLRTLLTIALRP
ncbi:MAG: hypothetical protein ACO1NQ_09495 [Flavobacteriales bacterium]